MSDNYTILHLHTMLSNAVTNIDSITTYDQYIEKAKEYGMSAVAFSEHGSVMGWIKKKLASEKAGLKYIHAEEFYLTETLEEKIRDNYHCLLIAKNYDGVLELNKLSSKSFNREDNSFYYVPRITIEDVMNTSDNIIVSTACLASVLNKAPEHLKEKFIQWLSLHSDRCYLEIQPHLSDEQIKYNQYLYDLSKQYDIPLLMCTDTHALDERHIKGRTILQKAKNIHFEGEDDFCLQMLSYDELVALCYQQNALPKDEYLQAIEATNRVADSVETFELDYSYKYPHLWGGESEKILREKIKQGLISRGIVNYPNYQEYLDRIEYEMKAYIHNGAVDFMLLMEDIIVWCKAQDIQVGYSRGSCGGSIVAYLLGITEMDSIKHHLNFDRFMSIERVSLSDIDTDFAPSQINKVKEYVFNKQGLYCADIITFNTIALKGAIRDVGRALEIPLSEVDSITNEVEKNEAALRKKYPTLFEYVDIVKGCIVSVGSHPSGMIVAPHSIVDRMGLFTTSTDTVPISQINMKEVDLQNYVKLDLLKLDTIELINETCKLAKIDRLTPDNVDVNDINVWDSIKEDTTGIFQWESGAAQAYLKRLLSDKTISKLKKVQPNIDYITLLSMGNGAIRPAGESYREELANGDIRTYDNPAINDFMSSTFGFLIFQEQIIGFLNKYCGFSMGEADVVRRNFSKKLGTEGDIEKIKAGFIKTMKEKYNMPQEEAEKNIISFLKVIEDASNYLFSLNHSQPYSYEGYVCGYLRYYCPLEFLTTAFNINKDNEEKTLALNNYAKKNNIKINPPQFGYSKGDYYYSKQTNSIYKGIGSLKGFNTEIGDKLFILCKNKYKNFIKLLYALKETSIKKNQIEILIKIGYFKQYGEVNALLYCWSIFEKFYKTKNISIEKFKNEGYNLDIVKKCCNKQTDKTFQNIDNYKLIFGLVKYGTIPETTMLEKIKYQIQYLNSSELIDKAVDPHIYIVAGIKNTNYGSTYVTLYSPCYGAMREAKASKTFAKKNALEQGDVLKCIFSEKYKMTKNTQGDYVRTNETYNELKCWQKIG